MGSSVAMLGDGVKLSRGEVYCEVLRSLEELAASEGIKVALVELLSSQESILF